MSRPIERLLERIRTILTWESRRRGTRASHGYPGQLPAMGHQSNLRLFCADGGGQGQSSAGGGLFHRAGVGPRRGEETILRHCESGERGAPKRRHAGKSKSPGRAGQIYRRLGTGEKLSGSFVVGGGGGAGAAGG